MPRCNAGGGRYNQQNNNPAVPRRAMFSNFSLASGKQGGKGSGKGGKGDDGKGDGKSKGKRPVFESQKEMDKWKGQQKGQAAAAAATTANASSGKAAAPLDPSVLWQKTDEPSYVHGVFCMTRDDHLALEALLTESHAARPVAEGTEEEKLPPDVFDDASENLRSLGFLPNRVKSALEKIGPQLMQEAEDREFTVTTRIAAERALEWLCSVTAEDHLPSRLREPREVGLARRRQEERNVSFQTRALLLGGEMDTTHITRIEKLGFSRARAIEALAKAPGHDLLAAVKALLADYLPLEVPEGTEGMPSSAEELMEEAEALQCIYGEDDVHTFQHYGNFEIDVAVSSTDWRLAVMIPDGLLYPLCAPLLCPKHSRLREAARPRLLAALGEVCRDALGMPMLLLLCEWLQNEGERFLVPEITADAEEKSSGHKHVAVNSAAAAVYRSLEASEAKRKQEEEAAKEREKRVDYLRSLQEQEDGFSWFKPKDKLALEIREDVGKAREYDLAGYDDSRCREMIREAFSAPLRGSDMVRITLVIGGGKAVRSKYSESLGKTVGTALQELGFEQDSAASASWESAGMFKGQHDTNRNLKLVHIFPKMIRPAGSEGETSKETPVAMHRRLAQASYADFVEEVQPWTRSREVRHRAENLLQYFNETAKELQEIESLLSSGQTVSEVRRRLYDDLGGAEDMADRSRWLAAALSPKPRMGGGTAGPDGTTLDIEAPSHLGAAARLAGVPGENDVPVDDDAIQLQRRITQTRPESERLRGVFAQPKALAETRQSLPAWSKREYIQSAIRNNQVIVIQGDTGCGKSTQVPQYILEEWVEKGEGGAANIVMTQPRRISAIGVSERIAAEMDTETGTLCGYSIRLESKKSSRTRILVCTTGVLLRRLETDRSLKSVTHIIVDECHERDLDTDFLLIVLRDLLPSRPALKVILMSATINAEIFRDYFRGCPAVHIEGRTFPVTTYYLEHAIEHTGFVVEPNSEYSLKDAEELLPHEAEEMMQLYAKDEYQELMQGHVSRWTLQQMHRMDPEKINFELVAAVVKHIHVHVDPPQKGRPLGAILVFVPGFGEIKKCVRLLTEGRDDAGGGRWRQDNWSKNAEGGASSSASGLWVLPMHSMVSVAEQRKVFLKPPWGQRKVVVTTNIAETSITIDDVEYVVDCGRHKETKYDPQNRVSMLVDCVETKANGKQRRGRAGRVKSGVCYHLLNVRKWRRLADFEKPEMLRVPLDSLCLRISLMNMGNPAKFLAKALTPPSEAAVRSSLQQLVELSAVEMTQRRPQGEECDNGEPMTLDKEDQERLLKAKLKLTPLGTQLAQLPVDAGIGKLLVLGCLFGIVREVCVLAAALSTRSPFLLGVGQQKDEVDKKRMELAAGLESDHLLLVSLFEKWEQLGKRNSTTRQWCRANHLDPQTFETVKDMRTHLLGVLAEQGFIPRVERSAAREDGKRQPGHVELWMPPCLACIATATEEFDRRKKQLLRALLCAALWPNVALRKKEGQMMSRNQYGLTFHPGSILHLQDAEAAEAAAGDWHCPECGFFNFSKREECMACNISKPPPGQRKVRPVRHRAFMFSEKTRTVGNPSTGKKGQTHMRDCSGVPLKALYLLGHRVVVDYLSGRASVDGWVHSSAAPRDAAMLLGLRRKLQEVLSRSLGRRSSAEEPLSEEDREVIDVVTAVLVLDVE